MIKILMSSTTPIQRDGISGVMINLTKHINKKNYHIDFISINDIEESLKSQIMELGCEITVIPRTMKHPIRYILKYAKVCKSYDIVHVHGNSATMVLEMIAASIAGVKIRIAHSHNTYCLAKKIDKICRPLFQKLVNVRLSCGEEAGKWLFGDRKFFVINNGVNASKYAYNELDRIIIRNNMSWNNKIVLGNVANFLEAKNHKFLIEVFKSLLELDEKYRLVLIGSGELLSDIQKLVSSYQINDLVSFTGSISNVESYLSAMDYIVMPSVNEGLPLTLIEEQSNGLICFVSNQITNEVDVSGNVKFLGLEKSADEWAKYIDCVVREKYDRHFSSFNAQSAIRLNGYDILESVKKLEEIYSNAGKNIIRNRKVMEIK